ncbi:hypothetical protein AZ09_13250 [Acetobacter aceti 1023]|nr:hypothetical protein AZ09_13250 [Acetobacter aceti 1023]
MEHAIAAIRNFNRFYTKYIGALDSRFLGSNLSLTEARLLQEIIKREPVQANVLQEVLTLDRGYLSRIIRRFEKEGWIMRERSLEDGRSRPMKLTSKGRIVFENVDQKQYNIIEAVVSQLTEAERQTLANSLTSIQKLLTRASNASSSDVLGRPVWHALSGRQNSLSIGNNHALRFQKTITPFGAATGTTDADVRALGELLSSGEEIWLLEKENIPVPPGLKVLKTAELMQMVASHVQKSKHDFAFFELATNDASDMLELARLTVPGPFQADTYRLGGFVGIREKGRLVAMAGERMKPGNFTEVSGVCTHPDYRGRGYAGFLMRIVAQRILDRGEKPFLHTYSDNKAAIALYQTVGFTPYQSLTVTILQKE